MRFTMAGQTKRTDSSKSQIDVRVPVDVVDKVRGTVDFVSFPAMAGEPECIVKVTYNARVKISLRTANPMVAKVRSAVLYAHLERVYDAARTGPSTLTHQQVSALAGRFYEEISKRFDADPGERPSWVAFKAFTRAAQEGRIVNAPAVDPRCFTDEVVLARSTFGGDLTTAIDALPKTESRAGLEERFGLVVNWLLALEGMSIDAASRQKLLTALAGAAIRVAKRIKRRTDFDWSDNPDDANIYASSAVLAGGKKVPVSVTGLLGAAFNERAPTESTVAQWTKHVDDFVAHVGHDEAGRVTKSDVVSWKDKLFASGLSAATINKSKLAAVHKAFSWGVKNDKVVKNPAEGVSVDRDTTSTMEGFSDDEAMVILTAALASDRMPIRWIPWLCASSGARVAEVAKLRSEDVFVQDGIAVMRLVDTEIGRQKNRNSQRTIPLHSRLVDDGFLEFAKSRKGPLFFDPSRRSATSKKPAGKIVGARVGDWVRTLGIAVGRKHHKDPNHAWRHRFTTLAREARIADSVIDIIKGNAAATVSHAYGTATLQHLKTEIEKIPLPRPSSCSC